MREWCRIRPIAFVAWWARRNLSHSHIHGTPIVAPWPDVYVRIDGGPEWYRDQKSGRVGKRLTWIHDRAWVFGHWALRSGIAAFLAGAIIGGIALWLAT